jgi:hypothetical protein
MPLDRNANTETRLRRNAQRLRRGGATSDILLNAPLALSAGRIGLTLGAATGLQVQSNALGIKLASNPGLSLSASGLTVALSDTSLQLGASGVSVRLAASPGLEVSTGLKAKVDGTTVTINGSGALQATAGVGTAGLRNLLLNGDFRVAQRGTSFSVTALTNAYTLDRWAVENQSDGVITVTQETDVPSNKPGYSLKLLTATADASLTSTQYVTVGQKIEGFNVEQAIKAGSTIRVSGWIKVGTGGGVVTVALRNSGKDRSFLRTHTPGSVNVWEAFDLSFSLSSANGSGTWDYTTGTGLYLTFTFAAGTSFENSISASWLSTNAFSCSSPQQTNYVGTLSRNFLLHGIQAEVTTAAAATSFEPRPYGLELGLCQRYYEKMNGKMVVRATSTNTPYFFKATKRTTPTVAGTFTSGTGATFTVGTDSCYQNANHSADSEFTATVDAEL